jgi:hypothetical protein
MRLVVDTNFLETDEFGYYLSDPANAAVVPDLAIIETLAGRDLPSIYRQLRHLIEHPSQVIVLKPTADVGRLRPRRRSRGLQRRIIDKKTTTGFPNWSALTKEAEAGDENLQAQITRKCEMAAEDLAAIAKKQETYAENLAAHSKKYTATELKILRTGEPVTPELFSKISENIFEMARSQFAADGHFKRLPFARDLANTFIFRYAVSGYVHVLRCIKDGGMNGASPDNIRNSLVDALFAAYASYFDGFLSNDKRSQEVYGTTCELLQIFHRHFKTPQPKAQDGAQ